MDRYLLMDPDVPFVQDGIRDGEHLRVWMYERFRAELDARGFPYDILNGSFDRRYLYAQLAIENEMEKARI